MTSAGATQPQNQNLLREAIARNAAAVLSLPSAGLLRHHKSRFLADAGDGFWMESVPAERLLVDELVGSRRPVGISFKSGTNKVVFTTPISHREPQYRVNALTVVEAILLPIPAQVKSIQRRSNYRVKVLPASALTVRVWRIAEKAYLGDRPMAAQGVDAELRDISLGGVGVTFVGRDGQPPKVSAGDRLRIELTHNGGAALLVEGRLRHPDEPFGPGANPAGIQFVSLDGDLEGRQKLAQLTRIVGELHREEVRRARRGL
jgi:c-di-GMP-binding flagellar brake protein YcgR